MSNRAIWLSNRSSHGVRSAVLQTTFSRHSRLSDEQKAAITHITGGGRIAAVIGRAGAGKTTMMKAAREAWEAAGYRVVGGALSGKAAEGLEKEAGITSRTLASWELRWRQNRNGLDSKTIFVLDEAGMISSRQMAHFVEAVARAGAKLVLVGDPEQLQPIEAGAAFRAIADRIGYAELETIYRQREQWMREAALDLARGNVSKAIDAYHAHGKLSGSALKADAVRRLIADWSRDYDPANTSLILAHLRRDVRLLNDLARGELIERGIIEQGSAFKTVDGTRHFAAGDQIVFLRNEGSLGVKNGMLAKVVQASPGRIVAEVGHDQHLRHVTIEQRFYRDVDHGYATTIHKSQGATVDRVKVLASLSLDRHLTYVAMTRHREDLCVYYGQLSFDKAGGLVGILSRKNAKETTLDYTNGGFYRQALRFAEARGLHLLNVARTVALDRLDWIVRQRQRLINLGARLARLGGGLDLVSIWKSSETANSMKHAKPIVSGITTFPKSLEQAVEDKLADDPGLKKQWEEVSFRFRLVYEKPDIAFKAIDVDAMIKDDFAAKSTVANIRSEPERFGALKGKTGIFASRLDKQDRLDAKSKAPALARTLERYIRQRREAKRKYEAEERAVRARVSIDIPSLSPHAKQTLDRVRDTIDRREISAALEFGFIDREIKAELDAFAKALSERFGERTFLTLAAREPTGETFRKLTSGMSSSQKSEVQNAWDIMRTVQELVAYERTTSALKQAETARKTKSQGLSLK